MRLWLHVLYSICQPYAFDSHKFTHQTKMIFFYIIFALNYRNFSEEHKLNQHLCGGITIEARQRWTKKTNENRKPKQTYNGYIFTGIKWLPLLWHWIENGLSYFYVIIPHFIVVATVVKREFWWCFCPSWHTSHLTNANGCTPALGRTCAVRSSAIINITRMLCGKTTSVLLENLKYFTAPVNLFFSVVEHSRRFLLSSHRSNGNHRTSHFNIKKSQHISICH